MKQINDIPVRRRPQSKDLQPDDPGLHRREAEQEPARQRRPIWDVEDSRAPRSAASDVPAPEPARPKSTPLILRNATPAEDAPSSRVETRPELPDDYAAPAPAPSSRPVSRPRAAEPMGDPDPVRESPPPQPASMRPRSRPITTDNHPGAETRPIQISGDPEGAQGNRAKTKILGFHSQDIAADPMAGPQSRIHDVVQFPAGWIVVVDGPGRGASFAVGAGVSTIGRAADQAISLDFGDMNVSRSAHAAVAFDEEQNKFYIGHGGKSNVVRRNGSPVLATEELEDGDLIRIGKTTLRFVALCGPDFSWENPLGGKAEGGHV